MSIHDNNQVVKSACHRRSGGRPVAWVVWLLRNRLAASPHVFITIWIFLTGGVVESAANQDLTFHASGVIAFTRHGSENKSRALNFDAFICGNMWLIRTEPFEFRTNANNCNVAYYAAGSNGTNVYSGAMFNPSFDLRRDQNEALTRLKQKELALSRTSASNSASAEIIRGYIRDLSKQVSTNSSNPEPKNKAVGEINSGVIPEYSELDLIAPVWLALASHGVFELSAAPTNLVPGLFQSRDGNLNNATDDSNLFVSAGITRSPEFPYSAKSIEFSNAYAWIPKAASTQPSNQLGRDPNKPTVEASYEATLKPYDGLLLPSTFKITKYSKQHVSYIIVGIILEVTTDRRLPDYLPHFEGVAAIADFRHIGDNIRTGVRVFTRPGEWPSVETVRGTAEYARVIAMSRSQSSKTGTSRIVILLSIALFSAAIAVLALKARKHSSN